ncbi:hypothetical protein HPB48_010180 [Haemaphysalis longicornis]|uniref:Uncharacterized protein n=1 Tax=Haemaphysalis longicornis TaxID=44386 RepID=A0A9J6FYG4_HAELO|nr:hypothetical protein HPB48_010180 [Haemaphysalis longicornis]
MTCSETLGKHAEDRITLRYSPRRAKRQESTSSSRLKKSGRQRELLAPIAEGVPSASPPLATKALAPLLWPTGRRGVVWRWGGRERGGSGRARRQRCFSRGTNRSAATRGRRQERAGPSNAGLSSPPARRTTPGQVCLPWTKKMRGGRERGENEGGRRAGKWGRNVGEQGPLRAPEGEGEARQSGGRCALRGEVRHRRRPFPRADPLRSVAARSAVAPPTATLLLRAPPRGARSSCAHVGRRCAAPTAASACVCACVCVLSDG